MQKLIKINGRSLLLLCFFLINMSTVYAVDEPWSVNSALNTPDWLSISGSHRTRYEFVNNQFRANRSGGDQALLLRTMLLAKININNFEFAAEFMDSRAELVDTGTPVNPGLINSVDLLQAYASWTKKDLLLNGSSSQLKVGRFTMDVGSRRFVARNRFRNTINTFTGFDWQWSLTSKQKFRAFYTLPVNRLPNQNDALLDNDIKFDQEITDIRFWGIYFSTPLLQAGDTGEIYFFGLNEDDSNDFPTRNRDLYTAGFRLYRSPAASQFDFQLEPVIQFGTSRSSPAVTNTKDLDNFAQFVHAELGYTFEAPWKPRLILQYDYGSGDHDPNDADNERLDGLFGGRRFEFGPTSIFGPFSRSNISSPGVRLKFSPLKKVKSFIAYRGFWLAKTKDVWSPSRVRDISGNSGDFIGHQIEMRIRWEAIPKNIRIETGFAHIFEGEFMRNAPNSPNQGDSTYFYSQASFYF